MNANHDQQPRSGGQFSSGNPIVDTLEEGLMNEVASALTLEQLERVQETAARISLAVSKRQRVIFDELRAERRKEVEQVEQLRKSGGVIIQILTP
jgi:hypothetical protein